MRIEQESGQHSLVDRLLRPLRASLDDLRQIKLNESEIRLRILCGVVPGAMAGGYTAGPLGIAIGAGFGGLVGIALALTSPKKVN